MTGARAPVYASVGFLLAYAIPGLLIACIWLGTRFGYLDAMVFVPLLVGYVGVPLVQSWRPYVLPPLPEAMRQSGAWRLYYRLILLLSLPAQLAMLAVATQAWVGGGLSLVGRFGLLLATGVFSAMFAINIGHHLIHQRQRLARALGGVLLSTVGFGSFKVIHLRVHHRYVGTPLDFATPRRGQSIYAFWRQSFVGNFATALRVERERLARVGRTPWRSELVAWTALSLLWLGLGAMLWGGFGVVFLVLQSVLAVMKLDCINYLQHYGLTRAFDADGRLPPAGPEHSWTQGLFLHDLILLNLPRHSDHHANPERPYELLRDREEAPRYPYNYAVMSGLLLIPPLFRRVVHPCLDRFAARLAEQRVA
jgi:alkane 1-monooxygenase